MDKVQKYNSFFTPVANASGAWRGRPYNNTELTECLELHAPYSFSSLGATNRFILDLSCLANIANTMALETESYDVRWMRPAVMFGIR
jgi:hypothetical protein